MRVLAAVLCLGFFSCTNKLETQDVALKKEIVEAIEAQDQPRTKKKRPRSKYRLSEAARLLLKAGKHRQYYRENPIALPDPAAVPEADYRAIDFSESRLEVVKTSDTKNPAIYKMVHEDQTGRVRREKLDPVCAKYLPRQVEAGLRQGERVWAYGGYFDEKWRERQKVSVASSTFDGETRVQCHYLFVPEQVFINSTPRLFLTALDGKCFGSEHSGKVWFVVRPIVYKPYVEIDMRFMGMTLKSWSAQKFGQHSVRIENRVGTRGFKLVPKPQIEDNPHVHRLGNDGARFSMEFTSHEERFGMQVDALGLPKEKRPWEVRYYYDVEVYPEEVELLSGRLVKEKSAVWFTARWNHYFSDRVWGDSSRPFYACE